MPLATEKEREDAWKVDYVLFVGVPIVLSIIVTIFIELSGRDGDRSTLGNAVETLIVLLVPFYFLIRFLPPFLPWRSSPGLWSQGLRFASVHGGRAGFFRILLRRLLLFPNLALNLVIILLPTAFVLLAFWPWPDLPWNPEGWALNNDELSSRLRAGVVTAGVTNILVFVAFPILNYLLGRRGGIPIYREIIGFFGRCFKLYEMVSGTVIEKHGPVRFDVDRRKFYRKGP